MAAKSRIAAEGEVAAGLELFRVGVSGLSGVGAKGRVLRRGTC